jgi:hypothetical protein
MSTSFGPVRMFIGTNDDYAEMRPGQVFQFSQGNQHMWTADENAGMWVFWVNSNGDPELAFSPESKWSISDSIPVWNANIDISHRDPLASIVMHDDGNLAMYDRNGNPSWSTGTQRSPGSSLVLHKSGFMGIKASPGHGFSVFPLLNPDYV